MDKATITLASIASVVVVTAIWSIVLAWFRRKARERHKQSRDGMFRFKDGVNIRVVDPIEVLQKLDAHKEFRIDLHPRQAEEGSSVALKICIDAIQYAFGVEKFTCRERPGLTSIEMLRLLQAFEIYALRVKKNTKRSLT